MTNNGAENRNRHWAGRVHCSGAGLFEDQI